MRSAPTSTRDPPALRVPFGVSNSGAKKESGACTNVGHDDSSMCVVGGIAEGAAEEPKPPGGLHAGLFLASHACLASSSVANVPSTGATYAGISAGATREELKPPGGLHVGLFLASQACLAASSVVITALTE